MMPACASSGGSTARRKRGPPSSSRAGLFPRHSFDLIYARPGQTPAAWAAELRAGLGMANGHLSVYQLTIEPGTRFHALVRSGAMTPMDDDDQATLYELTQELLGEAGLPAYEVSNHARPGEESRHNLTYWRYGDYAGIGPGAHGRLTLGGTRWATRAERAPERWLELVEGSGSGELPREPVTADEQATECLMMGLRLAEGVPLSRLERIAGRPWREVVDESALARLGDGGFLDVRDGRLVATAAGRQRLDALLVALLP